MGVYDFETRRSGNPTEKKATVMPISRFKLCKQVFFTFLLGMNIFFEQYRLFYENRASEDFPGMFYKTVMAIYLISAAIKTAFTVRIFVINKETNENSDLITILITSGVFIVINTYLMVYYPKSNEFETYPFVVKLVYTCLFTPCLLFLQITPFLMQILVAKYTIQCKFAQKEENRIKFYNLMIRAEADAGLVNVLDCYLRAAPLLIVQLSFLLHKHEHFNHISGFQLGSALTAVIMMPWSITSFQGCLRMQKNYEVPTKTETIYFGWHFFIMLSRISSTAAAAAFWPVTTAIVILVHCICATAWLWWNTKPMEFTNRNNYWHFVFCCVFGYVYFYYPISLVKGPTFRKYFWFYGIMFVENAAANVCWLLQEQESWKNSFVGVNLIMFLLGLGFMMIYYMKFHPNKMNPLDDLIIDANDQVIDDVELKQMTSLHD